MSMPEFKALMTHTVVIRKMEKNLTGDLSEVSNETVKGFVEYGRHLKIEKEKETYISNAIVFLKDDCNIDTSYKYWQIDQTAPVIKLKMEVLKIEAVDDPRTGNLHHYELIVR